jgi:hypothetical protein
LNTIKAAIAALLTLYAFDSFASTWSMVASSAHEQVFIDSQSIIKERDGLVQVSVLENFAQTNEEMGQGVYEHKSRVMLVAVDCRSGRLSYEHWRLHANALGTGPTVWADSMQGGHAFFRPDRESGYERVVQSVCGAAGGGSN